MAQTSFLTSLLGYDPVERERRKREQADRLTASLLSSDPYKAIGFSIGQLFTAGAEKLFGIEDSEAKFQSNVRGAISAATQTQQPGSSEYYRAVAAALPQTPEYADSIAKAMQMAQKVSQEEDKAFKDTTKFVADNPEALSTEAQTLSNRIAAKLRSAGVDPTRPIEDPALAAQVDRLVQSFPETQKLNVLTQAASRGAMKLDMDLNKPESMPKLGFAADDGQPVYRQGSEQFKLSPGGQRVPYYGSFRKEGGDVVINSPGERFKVIGQFNEAVKDISNRMAPLNRALALNSRTDSPMSGAALSQELGAMFGDSQKAAAEIAALGNTGALDTRIAGSISKFLLGTGVAPQKADIDATLKAIRDNVLKPQYESIASSYRIAADNPKEATVLFPPFESRYTQIKGIEPKAPAAPDTVKLSEQQRADPVYAEGSVHKYQDGSIYKVQNGVLVKQKKKGQ